MRSTSEPDSRADGEARDTEDRGPDDAEPVRSDPWASGPSHRAHDDQTERFVPEQRDSEHDGHLYASDSYAEPETSVVPDHGSHDPGRDAAAPADADQAGHHESHEPTAVGVAHVDTDRSDAAPSAGDAANRTDHAKAEAESARAEAEEVRAEEVSAGHSDADDSGARREPVVETVSLAPAAPVALVEPVDDRPGDFSAVAVPVEGRPDTRASADTTGGETADETVRTDDETASELKPGEVPVAPVAGFFTADAVQGLRDRWRDAQLGFVDDPRKAVEDVKALVSEAVDQFAAAVSAQRDELDAAAGDDTEQYRVAVQRYRTFFDRLLDL